MKFFDKRTGIVEILSLEIAASERRLKASIEKNPSFDQQSALLTRHLLGSIDLSDVEPFKRNLTPDQRKAYVAEMSITGKKESR